jgi:nucleoid DNA-binding protein
MTLTKNKIVREIGRRTRLKNRDIQAMLETLMDVWTEELTAGGKIELENFLVMNYHPTRHRIVVRFSKRVRRLTKSQPQIR